MSPARSDAIDSAAACNRLLAALPPDELRRVAPSLELVRCQAGMILRGDGEPADRLYFPTTCIAALLCTVHDGSTIEHGIVGREGVVGIAAFLGGGPMPGRAEILIHGDALRMPAPALLTEFRRGATLQRLLLQYTQEVIVRTSLEVVCRTRHTVEQRLARLLLQVLDRWSGADLPLTQESLGTMLGARRETVCHASARLEHEGCIRHERGHITVLDAARLGSAACECYRAVAGPPGR